MNFRSIRAAWMLFLVIGMGHLVGQAAIIDDFFPQAGSPGETIRLTGSGFLALGTSVKFWQNKTATIVYISSDTIMTVKVPTGATTGPITAGGNYTLTHFTVVGSGPYISDISPTLGATNDLITIQGAHLATATAVKFAGTNAEFNPTSDGTQLSARVPYRAKSGLISVTTPTGTSNSPVAFTVIGPGPYISDFSPTVGGGGTLVAISGRFFLGVTDVQFNGSHGSGITTNSDTLIQVFAPAGVTTGPITVVTRLGTNTTSSVFYAPPVISSLSVSNGRPGTNVTISGASFLGATA
ncbi:MAG TPA: hypothetical protein VNZ22_20220, partial [Bacillota bacterium]|nr:hypothetical protein [Bacillota bacterium]